MRTTLGRATARALLVAGLAACSSAPKATDGSRVTVEQDHWSGTIRPIEARTGEVAGTKPPAQYHGTILMSRAGTGMSRTRIEISLNRPEQYGSVSWALSTGRCGMMVAPVLPISVFAPLEMSGSGRGDATEEVPFEFPTDGMYHVDIFSGHSARLTEVVACADLSYRGH